MISVNFIILQQNQINEFFFIALKENNQSSVLPGPEISALDVSNHISKERSNKTINESEKRKKPQKPIECHLCKRTFTDRPEYKNHLKIHSKARHYECSICKKLIVGRIPYMKHLNDVHSDENGSMLRSCKYCSKEFKKPSDLVSIIKFFNIFVLFLFLFGRNAEINTIFDFS